MTHIDFKIEVIDNRAVLPTYAHEGDACFDIGVLVQKDLAPMIMLEGAELLGKTVPVRSNMAGLQWVELGPHESCVFHTGWKCSTEKGNVLLIFPRSSTGIKKELMLSNSTGIIDTATYRGEILIAVTNFGNVTRKIYDGDRVAQGMLLPLPNVSMKVVEALDTTARGEGGIGSTGD